MTLPASGAITLTQIADEFLLAHASVFPTAFYGKGGAPSSGALSLEDFYGRSNGFTVTAAPESVAQNGSTATVTTGAVLATTSGGGVAPFTHSWTKLSGDAITATNAAAAVTAFQATGLASGEYRSATFIDEVTDSSIPPLVVDSNEVGVVIGRF